MTIQRDRIYEFNKNGQFKCVVGSDRDITNQLEAHEALNRALYELEQAQRIAKLGFWEWDFRQKHLKLSKEMTRLLGELLPEELTGSTVLTMDTALQFVHPDDRVSVYAALRSTMTNLTPFHTEFRWLLPTGETRVIRVDGEVIRGTDGKPATLFGTGHNITELRTAEEAVRYKDKMAIIGQMAASVAHEIRNPLTVLKGFLKLLPNAHKRKQDEYIHMMSSEFDRIEKIVGELLSLAKPQAAKYEYTDLCTIVRDVVALMQPKAHMANVDFHVQASNPPLWIWCVDIQFKQMLMNLFQNAIEACPNGGVIRVNGSQDADGYVTLVIADDGVGIEPDRLEKIGEPFYTTKEKGTGLGLVVTQQIMQAHRGTFHIESQPGEGTTVTLRFPMQFY